MNAIPTFGLEVSFLNLSSVARNSVSVCQRLGLTVTSVRHSPKTLLVVHTIQDPVGNCILNRVGTNVLSAFADGITAAQKFGYAKEVS